MCDKAVDNYYRALKFVPDCYITQTMCDKAVITYHLTIQFVPDCYKTQEMCDKAVNRCSFEEMCEIVIFENLFSIVYCTDKYKIQEMCNEAVDDCLAALKFIPDWFVTSKTTEKLDNVLHANDDILFHNDNFEKITFIANQRHILAVDLDSDFSMNFVKLFGVSLNN